MFQLRTRLFCMDAVIITLVSHARLLERFLCLRRWLVVTSLPPLRLPAHHSLFLPQMTLYLLASFRTVISVLCRPLLTKRVTTWSQIRHLPPQVLLTSVIIPLPAHRELTEPLFTWGSLDGPTCLSLINEVYDVVVHWRFNLFRLPSGKMGERFVQSCLVYSKGMLLH